MRMRRVLLGLQSRALRPRIMCALMVVPLCIWTTVALLVLAPHSSRVPVSRILGPKLSPLAQPMSTQMREIRAAAAAAWSAYAATGMAGDDVRPIRGGTDDSLQVRATLYDSLGTLYVMGLHDEFRSAVAEVLRHGAPRTFLHQTSSFEYNIRIVGGLLSAAQLSGDSRLLAVAEDAAHTLISSAYLLWPSALPMTRVRMQPLTLFNFPVWCLARVLDVAWYLGERVFYGQQVTKVAKVGSFSLELRALAAATGSKRYAVIADAVQSHLVPDAARAPWPLGPEFHKGGTALPQLWDTLTGHGLPLTNTSFYHFMPSLGTGSDSFWEYLLKSHLVMPHSAPQLYVDVYRKLALQLAFEAKSKHDHQFLFAHRGKLFISHLAGQRVHEHLGCYLPALLMLGALSLPERRDAGDMEIGLRLLDGCLWTCVAPPPARIASAAAVGEPQCFAAGTKMNQLRAQGWGASTCIWMSRTASGICLASTAICSDQKLSKVCSSRGESRVTSATATMPGASSLPSSSCKCHGAEASAVWKTCA
jgi:hypothetical protein